MSELSAAARALIREGQSALKPSAVERARVTSALASRLGEGTLVLAPSAAAAAAVATGRWLGWQKVGGLLVGAGLLGLGAGWELRDSVAVTDGTVTQSLTGRELNTVEPITPTVPVEAIVPVAPETAPPPDAVAPAGKPSAPADRLAEEVSILSKATSELRGGRPAEALRLLTEHQRRFPGGRLVEERRAARIQALCALGNRAAAESELGRLARSSPRSPHLARAQQACGRSKTSG
jgi:hypothetical protein